MQHGTRVILIAALSFLPLSLRAQEAAELSAPALTTIESPLPARRLLVEVIPFLSFDDRTHDTSGPRGGGVGAEWALLQPGLTAGGTLGYGELRRSAAEVASAQAYHGPDELIAQRFQAYSLLGYARHYFQMESHAPFIGAGLGLGSGSADYMRGTDTKRDEFSGAFGTVEIGYRWLYLERLSVRITARGSADIFTAHSGTRNAERPGRTPDLLPAFSSAFGWTF